MTKKLKKQIQKEYITITDFSGEALRKLAEKYSISYGELLNILNL